MVILLNVFFIILLFVFQTTALHRVSFFGVRPDIILIFTIFLGFKLGEVKGAAVGFCLGFVQDCLSSSFLGPMAFSKGIIGFIFGSLRAKIFFENIIPQAICSLFGALIQTVIVLLIFLLTIFNKVQTEIVLNKLLIASVYTAITGPLFVHLFVFVTNKQSAYWNSNKHKSQKIRPFSYKLIKSIKMIA